MSDTTINQTITPAPPTPPTKPDGLARMILWGSSFAGGGTLIFAVFGLIRDQPDRAFKLLEQWGPWFFLAVFGAWILYKLLQPVVTAVAESFNRISSSMEKQAESMGQLAAAVQQSADKDDRQMQEMQTLIAYAAQRSEKTYSMTQEFHEQNQLVLKAHGETLERIEKKIEEKSKS